MKKLLLALLICALPSAAVPGPVPTASAPGQPVAAFALAGRTPPLAQPVARRLESRRSSGETYRAATGELVDISVSPSYPTSEAIGQYWADFFAGLLHGDELQHLHALIAPLPEVQALCGSSALGCYGDNQLVMTGDAADGFEPEEVARHEYGHHVAFNRANPPWKALEWGPKRWASYAGICARARAGTAYPGDQSFLYRLNPGEAFAESYRLLNDKKSGAVEPLWPIVDRSFYPDEGALRAVEEDVVAPWTADEATVVRRSLWATGRRITALRVATPLDGTLIVSLRPAGSYDLFVVAGGDRLRPTGRASNVRETRLTFQICGQRSLVVLVAASAMRRFELVLTRP
jgi:hypothetical protein